MRGKIYQIFRSKSVWKDVRKAQYTNKRNIMATSQILPYSMQ